VVAPAIGGLPELIEEGRDGLLYPPGDLEALAGCLRAVEAGAVRGPSRPPPGPDEHLDRLLGLYRRALGGGGQAG
jgi:glycosyltransferase involved in cell wall biosynthesis